jgi:hypothetical protein
VIHDILLLAVGAVGGLVLAVTVPKVYAWAVALKTKVDPPKP